MMKVALVGLGYWGSKLLRNLVTIVGSDRVVAVDSHIDRLADATTLFPGLTTRLSLTDALTDPTIGAVMIATPVESHAPLATQALEAGKHVFVEKPLAGSVRDAARLTQLAESRGLVLMGGHTFLFSPGIQQIAGYLDDGLIGPVHYITSSRLALGLYRPDANVIWDLAPHDFSIIFHLLREFPSTAQTVARSKVRPGVPDVAFINLTFPSGTIAQVSVSWLAPKKVRNTVIVGEQKMVSFDESRVEEPIKIYDKGVVVPESSDFREHQLTYRYGDTVAPVVKAQEPLANEIKHFLACIERGDVCISDGAFSLGVVEALAAADRSWQIGGVPVRLGEEVAVPMLVDLRDAAIEGAVERSHLGMAT